MSSCTSKFTERFDIDFSSPELIACSSSNNNNTNSNSFIYASPNLTVSDLSLSNHQPCNESYLSSSPTNITKSDDKLAIKIKHFFSSHTLSRKKNHQNRYSSSSTNSNSSCSNNTAGSEAHSI